MVLTTANQPSLTLIHSRAKHEASGEERIVNVQKCNNLSAKLSYLSQ